MATATVPAAVPDPNDPPNTSTGNGPAGLLASMLAPVEPARPATFDIPAPAATDGAASGATEQAVAGASSAAYHGTSEAADTSQKNSASIEKKSIWRAWLLAGAARWGKGGGAHNKRLDMLKAKAAAHQVKESRQVSINRSGGLLPGKGSAGSGGSGSSGSGKGNSGGGKGASGASGKGPVKGPTNGSRNSNGDAHKGPSGSSGRSGGGAGGGSGAGGRGPGGGGSAGSNGNGSSGRGSVTQKTPKADDASRNQGPKSSKVDLDKSKEGKGKARDGGAGGGKNGATGPAGSPGKSGSTSNGGGASNGGAKSPGHGPAADTGKKGKVNLTKDRSTKDSKRRGKGDGKNGATSKDPAAKDGKPGQAGAAADKNTGPDSPATTTDKTTKDTKNKDGKGKADKNTQSPAKTQPDKPADGKPFTTKNSRETGYRDGIRAAIAVAHAKAYCDGVKDGWTDVSEAAERQKAELDKAHDERKKAREAARDKEQDVTEAGSSADHHKPQPIEVKGVDADTVWLGEGADRNSLSRGEVRSLKTFERRLETKAASMKKVAEGTKLLKAHAEAQSQKATALMEATKSVKGGEKLIASLVKTADDAKVQAGLAEEIHKRAVRAADGCAAVLANAQTRYGAMYKAVVDSDEKVPGEMSFYKDGATTNG